MRNKGNNIRTPRDAGLSYHEVVTLKQCCVRSPVMLIGETPQQDTINIRVTEVQRRDVIVSVSASVAVFDLNVELSDPQRLACAGSHLQAFLITLTKCSIQIW